jgi:hypothetical protein
MAQVLWLIVSSTSAFAGWVVAGTLIEDRHGWPWFGVFFVTWISAGLILQRTAFKGAPRHIEFIDP